jgi:ABC-type amino acid transport substrate-binding protein
MGTRKLSGVSLALVLITALLAGCAAPDENGVPPPDDDDNDVDNGNDARPTYTVGTDVPYPPFQELDDEGNFVGFDIDVMEEIARRNDWDIEWESRGFEVLIPAVQQGEIDMAISAMTITEARAQEVDFSIAYYEADQSITQREDDDRMFESLDDLRGEGLRFGVQAGTTAVDIVEAEFVDQDDGTLHRYDDYPLALTALKAGDVDVVMMDAPAQRDAADQDPDVRFAFEFPSGEAYGIAIQPGRGELLDAVNDALLDMREDGTLDALRDQWGL